MIASKPTITEEIQADVVRSGGRPANHRLGSKSATDATAGSLQALARRAPPEFQHAELALARNRWKIVPIVEISAAPGE